jgi:hypothetical protein
MRVQQIKWGIFVEYRFYRDMIRFRARLAAIEPAQHSYCSSLECVKGEEQARRFMETDSGKACVIGSSGGHRRVATQLAVSHVLLGQLVQHYMKTAQEV